MTTSRKLLLTLALAAVAPAVATAEATTWNIDPAHSAAQFSVKHLVVSTVRGDFGKMSGVVVLDEANIAKSSVEASVDVTSINTRQPDRDKHLQSADFFDAEKNPEMKFKSTKVTKKGAGKLSVTGDLTIRETTKPATFDVSYTPQVIKGPQGDERRAFSGTTKISRKAYGLNWSKMVEAGPVVGDEVTITIDLEVIKATAS